MSITRWIALLVLVLFGGGGSLLFFRTLARRVPGSEEDANPRAGLGMAALGVVVFAALWFGFAFTEPPGDFLRALRDSDPAQAYDLLAPELQREMNGREGFAEWAKELHPRRWVFFGACGNLGFGRSDGWVWFEEGDRFNASFHVRRAGWSWEIQGIDLWEWGPGYRVGESSNLDCSD